MAGYRRIARKVVRKGARYAKKRYMRKGAGYGSGVRLNKLASDLRLLKNSLNTEKKYADQQQVITVGQVNGGVGGEHCAHILPTITHGTGGIANRVGNSIKLTGISVKFQVIAQDSTFRVAEGKFRFIIFEPKDQNQTAILSLQTLYDPNQITGLYDYNAERNIEEFKNFRIICNKTFKVPDGNDAIGAATLQPTFFSRHFSLKMNHHVKYENSGNTQVAGKLLWAVLFDHGNCSTSVISTNSNIPITATDTGYKMNVVIKSWYVDN